MLVGLSIVPVPANPDCVRVLRALDLPVLPATEPIEPTAAAPALTADQVTATIDTRLAPIAVSLAAIEQRLAAMPTAAPASDELRLMLEDEPGTDDDLTLELSDESAETADIDPTQISALIRDLLLAESQRAVQTEVASALRRATGRID